MLFSWNKKKNEHNRAAHGLDFVDAIKVFESDVLTYGDDRFLYGEQRFIALGALGQTVVSVVFTERNIRDHEFWSMINENDEITYLEDERESDRLETHIRIISFRPATPKEETEFRASFDHRLGPR